MLIKSPHKDGTVERFHLSLKSETFKNVIPINLEQTQRICREYQKYYNQYRPHQGISGKIPDRTEQRLKNKIKFVLNEHLGGKITSFNPDFSLAV